MRRLISSLLTFIAPTLGLLGAAQAQAAPQLTMPTQAFADAPLPGSPPGQATWSDLAGGTAARPYVKSLTVINGGAATPVVSGGDVAAAGSVAPGNVTAVISPINLCPAGQAPAPSRCYATPNRVSLTLGVQHPQGLGLDLAAGAAQTIGPDTILDVVIGLNTLGTSLRWTWANGDLISWKTTNLGRADAELRLRIKPVPTQAIDWSTRGPVGCTATPIRDCNLDRADGTYLGANLVLSLDDTLDAGLTGAVFATKGAIAGFLLPENGPGGPSLDLQIAAAHLDADGSLHTGAIKAILPATALATLYGGATPEQAQTLFTATRRGDAGTQSPPTFTPISESDTDTAGLALEITDITFSAPTYRVAPTGKRGAGLAIARRRAGKAAIFTAKATPDCKRGACTITLAKAGGKAKPLASAKSTKTGSLELKVPAARLKPGSYVVTVRKGSRTLASTTLTL